MNIVERDLFREIAGVLDSEEAVVITGCRQTGKTTALRYFFERVNSDNKLFLDLENVLNRRYFEEEDYERIKDALGFLGLDFSRQAYLFIDEIQYVKNLPSVVKYLKDHYKTKFFLTGSASFYIKNLFSESLAGRKYIFHIYPLTFKEFALFKNYKLKNMEHFPKSADKILEGLFSEYVNFGGFPGVVLKDKVDEKKKKLQEIFSSYFEMEVEKLKDFRLKKVRDTLLLLLCRSGSLLDISRLSQELEISRVTLTGYLDFFEKTFFFDFLKPFSVNRDVELRKRSKVYPVDVGLAREMGFADTGGLFELAVYQNLKAKNTINYYRRKDGREIDFIINKKTAIETKVFCHKQDVSALRRVLPNLRQIKQYRIVTFRKPLADLAHVEWAPHFCLKEV